MVKDITSGADSSSPYRFIASGSTLYFIAENDGISQRSIWESDGTETGTVVWFDICNQGCGVNNFMQVGSLFLYQINDGVEKLFLTDGTTSGTIQL